MYITPDIIEVKALKKYLLYIKFEDGKEKIYDMNELIKNNKLYMELADINKFKKIKPLGETVIWENGMDVCPENLYFDSIDIIEYKETIEELD